MYIAQAYKIKHDIWRYLLGVFIVFTLSQLGSIPLLIAAGSKIINEGGSFFDLEDPVVLMTTLESNYSLFLMLLSFAFGMLGVLISIKYLHGQTLKELTTTRKNVDWGRIFFGFGVIFLITVVTTGLDYYSNPDNYEVQFQLQPFIILAVIAILLIPIQTSFEEYVFRGYLMQGIGLVAKNRWVPLIITSIVFGGLHVFNPEVEKMGYIVMIYYIGTGLFLGIITLMDEGMELALGFHAGTNLTIALLVTSDWTVLQTNSILKDLTDPSAGIETALPVFIIYPILLAIMAKRYQWTNWNEKLFGKVIAPKEPMLEDKLEL